MTRVALGALAGVALLTTTLVGGGQFKRFRKNDTHQTARPVPVLKATFAATGATLTDDGSTLAHVIGENWTGSGGTMTPVAGPTWTVNGTPTSVTSTALFPSGFSATGRKGWNGWSDTKSFSLAAGNVLGTAPSGDFTCEVVYKVDSTQADQVPMSCGDGSNGWFIELGRTANPYEVFTTRGMVSANSAVQEPATVNRWCFGRSGSNLTSKLNLQTQTATAITGSYNNPSSLPAYIGRYGSTGVTPTTVTVYEVQCSSHAATDTLCASLLTSSAGMVADTGQTWTIARSSTESVTVNGNSTTNDKYVSSISETGLKLGGVGDAMQLDPQAAGFTYSGFDQEFHWTPGSTSAALSSNFCMESTSAAKVCWDGTAKTWTWSAAGASATTPAQSFTAGQSQTILTSFRAGSYAKITTGAAPYVSSAQAPGSIDLQPGEQLYIGGDATTNPGGSLSYVSIKRHADAIDMGLIPVGAQGPTHFYTANSVDRLGNSTVSPGAYLRTWKNLEQTGLPGSPCGYCYDATVQGTDYTDGGNPDQPVLRSGLAARGWAVTYDGVYDEMATTFSGSDLSNIVANGQFDFIVIQRRASSNNASPYNANIASDTERELVSITHKDATAGPSWTYNQDGGSHFWLKTGYGVIAEATGAESPFGEFAWVEASGDGTNVYLSNAPAAQLSTAMDTSKFDGGFADIGTFSLGATTYSFDGDVAAVLLYKRRLTPTERSQVYAWADARWGLSGAHPVNRVACVGDSITTSFRSMTLMPWCKQAELLDTRHRQWANFGMSGQETPLVIPRYLADSHGCTDYDTTFVLVGVNDIKNGSTPLATTEANITSLVTTCLGAGKKVVLASILPWKNFSGWSSGMQTNTDSYRTFLSGLAAAHPGQVGFVDWYDRYGDDTGKPFGQNGGDARALASQCDKSDGLHPWEPCTADMAAQALAAVNSLP